MSMLSPPQLRATEMARALQWRHQHVRLSRAAAVVLPSLSRLDQQEGDCFCPTRVFSSESTPRIYGIDPSYAHRMWCRTGLLECLSTRIEFRVSRTMDRVMIDGWGVACFATKRRRGDEGNRSAPSGSPIMTVNTIETALHRAAYWDKIPVTGTYYRLLLH